MKTENKEKSPSKETVRKDSEVYIRSGNFRGQTGKVLRVLGDKVVVQGINQRKKHVKPTRDQKGGIVTIEKPLHISNVCVARKK